MMIKLTCVEVHKYIASEKLILYNPSFEACPRLLQAGQYFFCS